MADGDVQLVRLPVSFTPEVGDEICRRLVEGESLRAICRDNHMPRKATVFVWLNDPEMKDFKDRYARARLSQAETLADEITDIADDGSNDWMERFDQKTGASIGWQLNGEHVQRSRLRIDTRKWYASKLAPKVYGDRTALDVGGVITLEHLILQSMGAAEPLAAPLADGKTIEGEKP